MVSEKWKGNRLKLVRQGAMGGGKHLPARFRYQKRPWPNKCSADWSSDAGKDVLLTCPASSKARHLEVSSTVSSGRAAAAFLMIMRTIQWQWKTCKTTVWERATWNGGDQRDQQCYISSLRLNGTDGKLPMSERHAWHHANIQQKRRIRLAEGE
jgi:hypothetical protein